MLSYPNVTHPALNLILATIKLHLLHVLYRQIIILLRLQALVLAQLLPP